MELLLFGSSDRIFSVTYTFMGSGATTKKWGVLFFFSFFVIYFTLFFVFVFVFVSLFSLRVVVHFCFLDSLHEIPPQRIEGGWERWHWVCAHDSGGRGGLVPGCCVG